MKKDPLKSSQFFWETGSEYFEEYLPVRMGCSPNTISSYREGINHFLDFLEGQKGVVPEKVCFKLFSQQNISAFQTWMISVRKLAPRTSNLRLSIISSFLDYAKYKDNALTHLYLASKSIPRTKTVKEEIKYFTNEQMKAILSAYDSTSKVSMRNMMILNLLYDTGARISEITSLKVTSVHLNAKTPYIQLHGKGNKFRKVPIMEITVTNLNTYLASFHRSTATDVPLFYANSQHGIHALSSDTVQRILKRAVDIARLKGVCMPNVVSCHMIRKTRAMDLYQNNVPLPHIQQLLGHSSMDTTSGFYAFVTVETLKKSLESAEVDPLDTTQPKLWKSEEARKVLRRF